MRTHRMLPLVRPTLRQVPWGALVAPPIVGIGLLALLRPSRYQDPSQMLFGVRLYALVIAVGVCLLFDDPATDLADSTPTRLWVRRAMRIGVALPVVLTVWGIGLLAARFLADTSPLTQLARHISIPMRGISVEAAAVVTLALAAAAFVAYIAGIRRPGTAAASIVLALAAAAKALPGRFALIVDDPASEAWSAARTRWLWLLVVAFAVLVLASRDPGARARLRRINLRRP